MHHDPEMLTILKKSIRSTGRKQLLVAALALPTGLFMVAAQGLGLDPSSFEGMSTFGLVLLYGFGVVFIATGAYMIYSALFMNARKGELFLERLASSPEQIRKITHNIYQHADAPGKLGQAHQIQVEYDGGSKWHLAVQAKHTDAILQYLADRAPHAFA